MTVRAGSEVQSRSWLELGVAQPPGASTQTSPASARQTGDHALTSNTAKSASIQSEAASVRRGDGGEATEAWCTVLDELIARDLRRPEFLIVEGLSDILCLRPVFVIG